MCLDLDGPQNIILPEKLEKSKCQKSPLVKMYKFVTIASSQFSI